MRLLFVKHSLMWPRSSGHDVHTYYMMKACGTLGHRIGLATVTEPAAPAIEGLQLEARVTLAAGADEHQPPVGTWLQGRFRRFWGVSAEHISALAQATAEFRPDAVVVVGLDALPYFPALTGVTRVWYAADEWVLHHLSQVRLRRGELVGNLRAALLKGVYERAHRNVIDHVWVVSDGDRRAMRCVTGVSRVDVLSNGVDGEFFEPGDETPQSRSAVFWGRLDFGPNIQALQWFCARTWPLVRRTFPDARFTIVGFHPVPAVRELAGHSGVDLEADVRDLRSLVRQHAVAVLPFVSGGGIKNKLLEAAALGMPIVCTPSATRGLRGRPPLLTASRPETMAGAIGELWSDEGHRRALGAAARTWVLEHHSWLATAQEAIAALEGDTNRGVRR